MGDGSIHERRRMRRVTRPRRVAYVDALWMLPVTALVLAFVVYPLWILISTSFSKLSFTGKAKGWAGLENYRTALADPVVHHVITNTVYWTVGVVVGTITISLGVALVLNETWPGRRFVRWIVIIPWATSLVITSLVFSWIFDSRLGTINIILENLGLISTPVDFLSNPSRSMPILIGVGIFVSIPFTTYVMLSGLQGIPEELYAAASIDGAGAIKRFRVITFPLLAPFVALAALLNAIYVFNSFPIIYIMTNGGPIDETQTIITYMYKLAFTENSMAEASALGTIALVILAFGGTAYWLVLKRQTTVRS
jgi:multiple sugar transport system permease protein